MRWFGSVLLTSVLISAVLSVGAICHVPLPLSDGIRHPLDLSTCIVCTDTEHGDRPDRHIKVFISQTR
jgi:hypothetical protein